MCVHVQTADAIEDEHLVFRLAPSSPRVAAELDAAASAVMAHRTERCSAAAALCSWQELGAFAVAEQQPGSGGPDFVVIMAAVSRANALVQVRTCGQAQAYWGRAAALCCGAVLPRCAECCDGVCVCVCAVPGVCYQRSTHPHHASTLPPPPTGHWSTPV